jgi:hypothetical protein
MFLPGLTAYPVFMTMRLQGGNLLCATTHRHFNSLETSLHCSITLRYPRVVALALAQDLAAFIKTPLVIGPWSYRCPDDVSLVCPTKNNMARKFREGDGIVLYPNAAVGARHVHATGAFQKSGGFPL